MIASAGDAGDVIPGLGRSPREGNGNPLQYSYLENPMDRGVWRATVHGVTKSQTGPQMSVRPIVYLGNLGKLVLIESKADRRFFLFFAFWNSWLYHIACFYWLWYKIFQKWQSTATWCHLWSAQELLSQRHLPDRAKHFTKSAIKVQVFETAKKIISCYLILKWM